jgi:hypothetical protein
MSHLSGREPRREWNAADARLRLSRRRFSLAIQICPVYVLRYRTGTRNWVSCNTRRDSMKILNRIERLEDELLPLPAGDTLRWNINAIDSEGKVARTIVFEVPLPPRPRAKYRTVTAKRDW